MLKSSHENCFACGLTGDGGLRLDFEMNSDGYAIAVWQPSPEFRSYPDRVHGGVIATLLDSSMVHALFAQGIAGVTAELNIRYKQSVDPIQPVQITGRVESCRHGIYLCSAEIQQAEITVARATAKFMAMQS